MADQLSTPMEKARSIAKFAFNAIEDADDQLLALAIALERQLSPLDPKDPEDSDNITAWRLAQVMCDMLGDSANKKSARKMVEDALELNHG